MYTEIPSPKRCCFFVPLRYGLIVWAYIKLILNLFVFCAGLTWLAAFSIFLFFNEYAIYILLLFIFALLLFFFDIVFSCVLIVGIHKKHTTLLRIFLRSGIAYAILFVIVTLMIVTFMLYTVAEINLDEVLHLVVIFITICSSFIILHTYLLLLVRSEIVKLKTNGQFHFVNHSSDPECSMQADVSPTDNEKEILT